MSNEDKRNRSTDIILKLRAKEGKKALTSTGMVDSRLLTGENNLHAVMDKQTCLWYVIYDNGPVPPQLKQRFTNFDRLFKHVTDYFMTRNIEIKEIID